MGEQIASPAEAVAKAPPGRLLSSVEGGRQSEAGPRGGDMPTSAREFRTLTRYAGAVASIGLATLLRLSLDPVLGDRFPFVTLLLAVLVSAWLGGFGPALLAISLGTVISAVFLLHQESLPLTSSEYQYGLALFFVVGLGIATLGGGMRRARRNAEATAASEAAQREQLRVTLESIGDGVVVTDQTGLVTSLNAVAAALTGWRAADACGRPLEEIMNLINEGTRKPVVNPVKLVLEDGRVVGLANHTLLVARDGTERPIDDSAAPIVANDGSVIGVVLVFRDVTENRRASERLRRNEQELLDLFENANVGVQFIGPDGTILRVNRCQLELLGYDEDEYVGRHVADFHTDRYAIEDLLRRLHAGETLTGCPARLKRKDGSYRDVLINSSVRWEQDRFVNARWFTLDVTNQRRADEARTLLAAVVETSEDAIVTKTLDGTITSWNWGAERLFGFSADDAVGKSITIIYPSERLAEEEEIVRRLRAGERVEHFETQRLASDGRLLDISLAVSPLRDENGAVVGASTVARDITARKRTEQALQESEERFRTLADNIAQFAWMADETGSVIWYNRRWFDYTGTTMDEMAGWGWQAVHHPDHVERVVEKIRRCFATGEVWEDLFPLRGRDGNYRWFLSRAVPIRDASGRVLRWFGTNTDVTAQREAEEALREVDRRKDAFLATLAHELRNPLAPLRTSIEIMKQADGDGALLANAQATMDRQVAHLERLVDDLLDIARINRDLLQLRREPLDLHAVLDQVVESCQPLAKKSGVRLAAELAPQPIHVDGDAVRLTQVFANLVNNACKYTDAGGSVSVVTRVDGDEAVVEVRDSGQGIPPEMLATVFEMFTQVDPSAERAQTGLGIGLTLVRRFVEMHGGTVEAHSEGVGRGSEFVVRLPRMAEPVVLAAPRPRREPTSDGRRRILVVDDNTDSAEALALLLRLKGHETQVAGDGAEALSAAGNFRPDVALLDVGLPVMSGHEVARRIRAEPWGKEMILIALTGWGQEEDRRKSAEVGFDHHLVKPVDVPGLLELLVGPQRSRGPDEA